MWAPLGRDDADHVTDTLTEIDTVQVSHCLYNITCSSVCACSAECDKLRKDGFRSSQYYSQGPTFSDPAQSASSLQDDEEDENDKKVQINTNAANSTSTQLYGCDTQHILSTYKCSECVPSSALNLVLIWQHGHSPSAILTVSLCPLVVRHDKAIFSQPKASITLQAQVTQILIFFLSITVILFFSLMRLSFAL